MEKRFFPALLLLLSFAGLLNAQVVSKKWAIVQDLDDRIVYIDTTTIKEFEQKVTIWSLVTYREPKEISPFQQKVYQIKSQFMINEMEKKYSVIGTLYYDIKGIMIGETSIPSYSFGSENFSIPIVVGSTIDVLHNKAKDYLTLGKFADEKSEFLKNFDKNVALPGAQAPLAKGVKRDTTAEERARDLDSVFTTRLKESTKAAPPVVDSEAVKRNVKPVVKPEVKKDTIKADAQGVNKLVNQKIDSTAIKERNAKKIPVDSTALKKLKNEIANEKKDTPVKQVLAPETSKPKKDEKSSVKKPVEKKKEEPKSNPMPGSYNSARETNPSGVIFTDGSLYCFQVSSWKLKSQADRAVEKLTSAGHNVFVQEADVPGKGKWFRVRIGYFNSLAEAQAYKRKVK